MVNVNMVNIGQPSESGFECFSSNRGGTIEVPPNPELDRLSSSIRF